MRRKRDTPFRTIHDSSNRADWLRQRGDGHAGFAELMSPGSTKRSTIKALKKRLKKSGSKPETKIVSSLSATQLPIPILEPVALSVPVPADRATRTVCVPSREGQARFRAMVIAAYGKCAVTGCQDEVALQAAHIIPYVDERSHVIRNGICLRADIHCLFDRGLVEIGADCTITVDDSVRSADYRALHGRVAIMPDCVDDRPCAVLLTERSKHL